MLDALVEARIEAARDAGELDDLPGRGRPLDLDDDRLIPIAQRMAFRILKNAGVVPEEVSLRKRMQTLHEQAFAQGSKQGDEGARSQATTALNAVYARLAVGDANGPRLLAEYGTRHALGEPSSGDSNEHT